MKKIIATALTAFSLTASAASFAAVDQTETAYLFGTQDVIEMQVLGNAEMQATEGQLFGITFELLGGYMDKAIAIMVPILEPARPHIGAALSAVKDAALAALAARFSGLLGGLQG